MKNLRFTIYDLRLTLQKFWSAVAERSGDTAFQLRTELPKRRGASLPAAVQKDLVAVSAAPSISWFDLK
jgi:hypothetical protein